MRTLLATLLVSGLTAAPALAQTNPMSPNATPPDAMAPAPANQADQPLMAPQAPAQQTPGQPAVVASQPVPDTSQASPGIPGPQAVNPAPGAAGPYVGHGARAFYDVDARISNVEQRVASLSPSERKRAAAALKSIRGEEATQKARHGQLRDWDRENLNYKLDQLEQQFPALGAQAEAGPQPPQPGR